MNPKPSYIELKGLDGSNPLAFLATLGVLLTAGKGARIHWKKKLSPVLSMPEPIEVGSLCFRIAHQLRQARAILNQYPQPAEIIKVSAADYSRFSQLEAETPAAYSFAACFASEAIRDRTDPLMVAPSRLSLANGNGGKKLILHFRQMVDSASLSVPEPSTRKGKLVEPTPTLEGLIEEAIFEWKRREGKSFYSFRWDPQELRRAAHMAMSPENDAYSPVPGANLLAVVGLTLLPSAPTAKGLATSCIVYRDDKEVFAWPLWNASLDTESVRSLLMTPGEGGSFAPEWCFERGVFTRFAVERYSDPQKNAYFNTSSPV